MDSSYQFPQGQPDRSRRPVLIRAVILLGILAVFISAYAYLPLFLHKKTDAKSAYLVSVTLPSATETYLYEYTDHPSADKVQYRAYSIQVGGKMLPVSDIAEGASSVTYYLLVEDTTSSISNIYRKDASGVTKVTNTNVPKRGLSFDPVSQVLSYETPSTVGGSSDIWEAVVYDPNAQQETKTKLLAYKSQILPGGTALLLVGSSSLEYATIDGRMRTTLVETPEPFQVAVKNDGSAFALYNPRTHSIDMYTYSPTTGVNYNTSSSRLTEDVHSVSYSSDSVLVSYINKLTAPNTYTIRDLSSGAETRQILIKGKYAPTSVMRRHE